ncbi:hypothetical protein C6I20_04045 [Aeromicrobium sp. A1-2]|nr:hypothetical protein C6I20_04045 [Aeromicrobium sp. A1-2]
MAATTLARDGTDTFKITHGARDIVARFEFQPVGLHRPVTRIWHLESQGLSEQLPATAKGRCRLVVIGDQSHPDEQDLLPVRQGGILVVDGLGQIDTHQ